MGTGTGGVCVVSKTRSPGAVGESEVGGKISDKGIWTNAWNNSIVSDNQYVVALTYLVIGTWTEIELEVCISGTQVFWRATDALAVDNTLLCGGRA